MDVDDPAAFADLHHEGGQGEERVRPGVQRPVAKRLDLRVQMGGHLRHLTLGQSRDTQLLDQLLHPAGRYPKQVGGRHHADQRLLGTATVLQQPFRKVRALPQLRNRQLNRASASVPVTLPVAVALVRPLVAALTVGRAAHRVGLGGHQRFGKRLQHRTQQIG